MIHVMRFRIKKTFIYDATNKEKANIEHQHFLFTQNTIFFEGSNMNIMDNVVNRQYVRSATIDLPFMNLNNNSNQRSHEDNQFFSV